MTSLGVAMIGAVMLCTDFVFAAGTMVACVAGIVVAFAILWYAMPLWRLAAKERT